MLCGSLHCSMSAASVPAATVREVESLEPLLDVAGAAQMLATSERHIRKLIYERRIPYVKVGGKVRFRQQALDRWIEANTVEPF